MPESPVIVMGLVLIMLGMFLVVFWIIMRSIQESAGPRSEKGENIKTGGVIMIGPLPVVLGSDKRSALIAMILGIALMLLAIMFIKWQ